MADELKTFSGDVPLGSPRALQDEPEITLINWQAYEVRWHRVGNLKTIHFIGDCMGLPGGRVSSSIQTFTKSTRKGISRSGRAYILSGPPGHSIEAENIWDDWQFKFGASDVQCVTDRFKHV